MTPLFITSDETRIFRETSGVRTVTMDRTGDTGSLLDVMRDAVLVISEHAPDRIASEIPQLPNGSKDALARF